MKRTEILVGQDARMYIFQGGNAFEHYAGQRPSSASEEWVLLFLEEETIEEAVFWGPRRGDLSSDEESQIIRNAIPDYVYKKGDIGYDHIVAYLAE